MNGDKAVVALSTHDFEYMGDLFRRADLHRMPNRNLTEIKGMSGVESREINVVEPILGTFRDHGIEFIGIRADDQRLGSLLIFAPNFPDPACWWIAALVVDPRIRRQGHASSLVKALKSRAAVGGATRLETVAWTDDDQALSFWQGQGFRPVKNLEPWKAESGIYGRTLLSCVLESL